MKIHIALPLIGLAIAQIAQAQTGSPAEPVRYIGGVTVDPTMHEGRLRYAIGTENRQTVRANRTHPEQADGYGWTYNHASNLSYWNGRFYQQYLSNPADEHVAPGQTLLVTSTDGRTWDKPQVVFPPYKAPEGVTIPEGYHGYMMHQRMGFYTAPDGRLLTVAFYGHTDNPFGKGGIGRVVREIHKDGTFGPIYFIRYSSYNTWNESNTSYPFYKKSPDAGFVSACDALLADKLMTFQWYDEDNGKDGFYGTNKAGEALSYYHRKDGQVVALWKKSLTGLSADGGKTFSTPVKVPTLLMSGGKVWGQKTDDGRYAISYNPIETTQYRYPLAIISGDDGIVFDNLLLVSGEVPPRRFVGRWKDFGPCYMRGIEEGNGNPPGSDMWMTYSVNKEDIWVARIPTPIRYAVTGPVADTFDKLTPGGPVTDWNIYAPKWAPVTLVRTPGESMPGTSMPGPSRRGKSMPGLCLELRDTDPYDYARAIRVFRESHTATVQLRLYVDPTNTGDLDIDLTDRYGNRPVRLRCTAKNQLVAMDGRAEKVIQTVQPGQWYTLQLTVKANPMGTYSLRVDNKPVLTDAQLAEAVESVERLSLRTGPYRNLPNRQTPNETNDPPLPGCDEQVSPTLFYIDDIRLSGK